MKRWMYYWLPVLLFAGLVIVLFYGLNHDPSLVPSPLVNKPVPAFKAVDLQHPNIILTQQQFQGHVSLLNVWATWCMACESEQEVLMAIANSQQVRIYGFNYKDQRQNALKWLAQRGNPYTAIIDDPTGQLAIDFGVYGTPETFLIDQKGIIRYKYIGAITPDSWRKELLPRIKQLQ